MRRTRILVVDDEAINRTLLRDLLKPMGHDIVEAADGIQAVESVKASPPDLILLDLMMPRMNGYDVCRQIKGDPSTRLIPIVMLTGIGDLPEKIRAVELGADDFLAKPYNAIELMARVRSLLALKRVTDEMEQVGRILEGMAVVVEHRDAYTAHHGRRLGEYAARVASALGMKDDDIKLLRMGGILHDIGKVAIPDSILIKPGKLDEAEWVKMRTHPVVGAEMCAPLRTMERVLPLVRNHHEKLDGSGYPDGLSGTEIPLAVRIVSVVDVYDALVTRRSYKDAWPREKSLATLREESERGWWDRDVIETLATVLESGGPIA